MSRLPAIAGGVASVAAAAPAVAADDATLPAVTATCRLDETFRDGIMLHAYVVPTATGRADFGRLCAKIRSWRACWTAAKVRRPPEAGDEAAFTFWVRPDGLVTAAAVDSATVSAGVRACVLRVARSIRFSRRKGGAARGFVGWIDFFPPPELDA
jgi:hypothetical protein